MLAGVIGGFEVLHTIFDPAQGTSELSCDEGDEKVFGVKFAAAVATTVSTPILEIVWDMDKPRHRYAGQPWLYVIIYYIVKYPSKALLYRLARAAAELPGWT